MQSKTKEKLSNLQIAALADAFGKKVITIERWIKKDHPILTSDKAKFIISRFK